MLKQTTVISNEEKKLYQFLASRNKINPVSEKVLSRFSDSAVYLNKEEVELYLGIPRRKIQKIVKSSALFSRPKVYSAKSGKYVASTYCVVLLNPKYSYLLDEEVDFEEEGKERYAFKEKNYKNYNERVFLYLLDNPDTKSLTAISKGTNIHFYAVRDAVNSLKNSGYLEMITIKVGRKNEHRFNLNADKLLDNTNSSDFEDEKNKVITRAQIKNRICKLNYESNRLLEKVLDKSNSYEARCKFWAERNKKLREVSKLKEEMPILNEYRWANTVKQVASVFKKLARKKDKFAEYIREEVFYHNDPKVGILDFSGELAYWINSKESIYNRVELITIV